MSPPPDLNRRTRRRLLWAAAGLVAGAAATHAASPAVPRARAVARIGVISEVTGAGAPYGLDLVRGAQMAVAEANDLGGIDGRLVTLEIADGGTSPARSALAMRRLALRDIDVVVGGWGSNQVLASLEMSEEAGLPFVVTGATHPAITSPRNRSTFRVVQNDTMAASALAEAAVGALGLRRIVVLWDGSAYGVGSRDAMVSSLRAARVQPVATLAYNPASGDFEALARQVRAAEPDGIALFGTAPAATRLLVALHRAGSRAQVLGTGGLFNLQIVAEAGPAASGMIVSGLFHEALDAESSAWAARFRSMQPVGHPVLSQPGLAAWTYRALRHIVFSCLDRQTFGDRVALRASLASWRGRVFGVPGETQFDAQRQLLQPVYLQQVRDGRFDLWRRA